MRFKCVGLALIATWPLTCPVVGQGLLVDHASGTLDEIMTTASRLPDNQIAQSFTPSLSARGGCTSKRLSSQTVAVRRWLSTCAKVLTMEK